MPKNESIKKVMVLGSGPIIIGQAAEFDYAGTQACRSLREEGIEVVLVNSNPATIMTDKDIADHVYIEPLNTGFCHPDYSRWSSPDCYSAHSGRSDRPEPCHGSWRRTAFWRSTALRLLGTSAESIRQGRGPSGL